MTTRTRRHEGGCEAGRARRGAGGALARVLEPTPGGVAQAAAILRAGGIVAIPTETVYGLAADATDPEAVARVFEAKGRPSFNPLIVHLADGSEADRLASLDPTARALAARFWPGPLTLVAPLRGGHPLAPAVTAGLGTVALRVPASDLARAVAAAAGRPLAAPSANPSGRESPTTAAHVLDALSGRIDAVLDGGPCSVGVESTIVSTDPPRLLREGGLPREAVEAATGPLPDDLSPARVAAPGQMASHYAPRARVRLGETRGPVVVGFGAVAGDVSLSPAGDVAEAARRLFAVLRAADRLAEARGAAAIAVAPVPEEGLGRAVNDRLRRAAAPRDGDASGGD